MTTRAQIEAALFALLEQASGFTASSQRFIHWDQVNATQMPFLALLKTGESREREGSLGLLTLKYHVFIYISSGMDPNDVPGTAMNALLDAVDASVAPTGSDLQTGLQTLGGLVDHVWPHGEVFVDNGDIDGKGVAAIPFEIVVPWTNP
jgi:hypothetical protein